MRMNEIIYGNQPGNMQLREKGLYTNWKELDSDPMSFLGVLLPKECEGHWHQEIKLIHKMMHHISIFIYIYMYKIYIYT